MMYWHTRDERNRLSLACNIYLAVLSITDVDSARDVCQDARERAEAYADKAAQLAQQTHEWYRKTRANIADGKYG